MGNCAVAQAAMVTSKMEQHIGDLRGRNVLDVNNTMYHMKQLRPYICYIRPAGLKSGRITSLSQSAHGISDTV